MNKAILWHNPKCSKSRQAVALLKEKGIDFEEVRYMDRPPSTCELEDYISLIQLKPIEVMRVKEALFKSLNLKDADEKGLIEAMSENPKLIERPVLFFNQKAIIGRPTEALLDIL